MGDVPPFPMMYRLPKSVYITVICSFGVVFCACFRLAVLFFCKYRRGSALCSSTLLLLVYLCFLVWEGFRLGFIVYGQRYTKALKLLEFLMLVLYDLYLVSGNLYLI